MSTKRFFKVLILTVVFASAVSIVADAQCAMCRATVENNVNNGNTTFGAGLNTGILYLMSVPYVLFSIIGWLWYKNSRKKNAAKKHFASGMGRPMPSLPSGPTF